jgi:ADP-heptose:LPS heptosyltransferase
VLCAPAAIAPLAALSGAVDEVLDTAPLAAPALPGSAAVAVNLHGRGPQSHRALAGLARRLIAFDCPAAGHRGPAWHAGEHEVSRWCRLLSACGIPADPADLGLAPPPWPAPDGAHGATLLHPGAAGGARRWPAERWAAVARFEREAGRAVAVTGSPGERELAEEVARRAGLGPEAVLAGRTDLRGLAAAVAAAARTVSGDTGLSHLATALGRPSVTLFGPTPPALWGPPPLARHIVLWAGRTGDPHAADPDPGLLEIHPADVRAALERLPAA